MTKVSGDWLENRNVQQVMQALGQADFRVFVVGGAVRDALLGMPVGDIDMATDARPDQARDVFEAAGFKVIPTGIDHGTLTVLAGKATIEVTTFRSDVATDGRRATVSYARTIEEDARRRDFHINALYAGADGAVFDPLEQGLADLRARKITFIGRAENRIREDYLRILRYYRFVAWISDPKEGFDANALAAIAETLDGLSQLSRERIGQEMQKLCAAPDPSASLANMQTTGVLHRLLPGADAKAVPVLVHGEALLGANPDPLRRLAALGGEDVAGRLRLSKAQSRTLSLLADQLGGMSSLPELAYFHGTDTALSIAMLRLALLETPLPENAIKEAERGAAAEFPIRAADLPDGYTGKRIGVALKALERAWIASDFRMTREQLLATL